MQGFNGKAISLDVDLVLYMNVLAVGAATVKYCGLGIYNQQESIPHSSGSCKSKIKGSAASVMGGNCSVDGTFFLYPLRVEGTS